MDILIVSNECDKAHRIGNPIIGRLISALKKESRVGKVSFSPFSNRVSDLFRIRSAAKRHDVIHIQFGGLYALVIFIFLLGINKPKLLTFHGTDIHAKAILNTDSYLKKLKIWLNQKASFVLIILMDKLGFVSETLFDYIPQCIYNRNKYKFFIQELGVDYDLFTPIDKVEACNRLGIEPRKYVLFSDKSNTILKRRDIANSIIQELADGYELLIMCGVKPHEVPLYINSCDFVLLTSDEEGSPNIVREALSCNKRVFSVDVGDVKKQLSGLLNSSIISRNPKDAVSIISQKISQPYMDNTRQTLSNRIDFCHIVKSLVDLYYTL